MNLISAGSFLQCVASHILGQAEHVRLGKVYPTEYFHKKIKQEQKIKRENKRTRKYYIS